MSTINWPASVSIATCDYGIQFDVQMTTMRNGRVYTYGLPGARWTATLTFSDDGNTDMRGQIEALITSLEGGANRLSMPHLGKKIPRGTLRGSPALSGAHASGAKQLALASAVGTLKAGDIIGIPGQLLMVSADCVASGGAMVVPISPALFSNQADGTTVTWNAPTTLWVPTNSLAGPFPYAPGGARPSFSIDLTESGI